MKDRRASFPLFTLLTAFLYSCSSVPEPPGSIGYVSELEDYLGRLVALGSPPGLAFAVVKGDSLVYCRGFGWADEPRNIRAAGTTVYHWWSCTKIATAIAVLQLREAGKLSLTDPVIQHLPFFDVEYPSDSSTKVTILHLLNHSSGLPDPSIFTLMSWTHHHGEAALNQTEFVTEVLPEYSRLRFEPGSRAEYSNLGYMVLGAIIESAAGTSYEEYIRRHILRPLRMDNTDFVYTGAMEPEEAAGSHPQWNAMTPTFSLLAPSFVREVNDGHLWMERVYTDQTPPSGLIGSVADASRLVAAYLNGGLLDGQRILSGESVAMMTSEGQIPGRSADSLDDRRQGIGWRVDWSSGRRALSHDGGGPGFRTRIELYPDERLGFVFFTNDITCDARKIVQLASSLRW